MSPQEVESQAFAKFKQRQEREPMDLHCWVNNDHELQIEANTPDAYIALVLPLNSQTLKELVEAYLWAMNDGEDAYSFPGRLNVVLEIGDIAIMLHQIALTYGTSLSICLNLAHCKNEERMHRERIARGEQP